LAEGLLLEGEQVLLAWGTAMDGASLPGDPELVGDNDVQVAVWRDRVALRGARSDARVPFIAWDLQDVRIPDGLRV
jgi:hypothetical protein